MFLAFTSREQSNVRFDVPMTRELTAVFQGSAKVGTFPDFSDCAGVHRTKIRAESSSNGSKVAVSLRTKSELSSRQMAQLKLRTAGLTPHFHAELL